MSELVKTNKMMNVLDWAYDKALNGLPGTSSAVELADSYLAKNGGDVVKACDNLISWQVGKCATSGFITGLGGIITLPIAVPANVSSVIYVQMRMIASIAYICGYNINDDTVKSLVYMCLTGNAAVEIGKDVGIKIGAKLSQSAIKKISFETIKKINQAVGFRLITKAGQSGLVNLSKAIPFIGGIIGGGVDLASTRVIGKISKEVFSNN
ncbi:EcsC family protein [Clostridium estertheticum]|uniref:EcsC family protein n=1 Tax=Clostridium estertheticum subsp. estertheticum TaxID=1552 RepID=A0A1J0GF54_9CLOT|nr:EcsC family protein [Clostridium estertheticum]APC40001.1 EcsC family protein [Clostridium estertheticum subsp. estertheticum]MBU3072499.1 EcsC family protein [Clostridium estertheticum]MBU3162592.1 EcsC family protein [Clostridium estertheticum]MBU3172529.1 EcsC family protein [Clostridium estertheticum]MBW9173351.1 EcsC family protein [Clostridium estertheticum]